MLFNTFAASALALATAVSAQTPDLAALLSSTPELSQLSSLLSAYPDLADTLAQLEDSTILAPSNDALAKYLRSPAGSAFRGNNTRIVEALLSYHVLTEVVPSSAFETTPAFVPTLLQAPTYHNVTDGQKVSGALNGSSVEVTTGLKLVSNVVQAVCLGPNRLG